MKITIKVETEEPLYIARKEKFSCEKRWAADT